MCVVCTKKEVKRYHCQHDFIMCFIKSITFIHTNVGFICQLHPQPSILTDQKRFESVEQ